MNIDKLMKSIEAVKVPKKYVVRTHEIGAIHEAANGEVFQCIMLAFRYGFIQGQKAAKAEAKKKYIEQCRREMEKHAPGYGLLTGLVEKHMSDERFIGIMCAHASALDGILKKEAAS